MQGDVDVLGLGRLARHRRVAAVADRLPTALDAVIRPRRFRQRRLVSAALADTNLVACFERGARLPTGYGVGLDERVVEYPWLLAQRPRGRVLDAGSVLNHPHVLARFLPHIDKLHIVNLVPERRSYPNLGISYVFADLRDLPYRTGLFDTVICVSTLEHVGMDNSAYGGGSARADRPEDEVRTAVAELRRVVAPGGRLLVTVPIGVREDLGWLRQFGEEDLIELVAAAGPAETTTAVFRYTREGWQVADFSAVSNARYRMPSTEPRPVDLAARARAVGCLALSF